MDPTQGNGPPEGPQGEPKFVTEEQLNKAISARFGAFEKKIEKSLSAFDVEKIVGALEERVVAKMQPQAGGDAGAGKQASGGIDESPVVKGLQKQLADLQKAHAEREQALASERSKLRDRDLRQKLTEELAKHGVDASRIRHAVGFLVDADKRVAWDNDSDNLLFRDADGDVDLTTGLKSWVKSDDGKLYLPPRGTMGSGDRPEKGAPGRSANQTQRGDLGRALLSMVGEHIPE